MSATIIGAATTTFGKQPERRLRDLATDAAQAAADDAGIALDDVEFVAFGNAADGLLGGQAMVPGQMSLAGTALAGATILNVENACASGSSAFHAAVLAVESGAYDVALAVGVEKMVFADRRGDAALARAADVSELVATHGPSVLSDGVGPLFMELYGDAASRYLATSGAPLATFAEAAAKAHTNASRNPRAHQRTARTAQEVLDSRPIAGPLTLFMCSPMSDGAAALVVARREAVAGRDDAVPVLASAVRSGRRDGGVPAVARAADGAYRAADIAPGDIDLVELHDAAASAEPITLEELGLAAESTAWKLVLEGETQRDGALPVNAGGGLVGRGHPIGATGCAQLVELVEQLRGGAGERQVAAPRFGLAENAGGVLRRDPFQPATATVTILGAPDVR